MKRRRGRRGIRWIGGQEYLLACGCILDREVAEREAAAALKHWSKVRILVLGCYYSVWVHGLRENVA